MESFTVNYWSDVMRLIALFTAGGMLVVVLLILGNSISVILSRGITRIRRQLHLLLFLGGLAMFATLIVQCLRTIEYFGQPMTCKIVILIFSNIVLTLVAWGFVLLNGEVEKEIEANMFRK